LSAERPRVPPSKPKTIVLRSPSRRRWSLTTRSRSVISSPSQNPRRGVRQP